MSLAERVRKADEASKEAALHAEVAQLEELKGELHQRVSSGELARLAAENPLRARNEIRSVCSHIFTNEPWADRSSEQKEELVEKLINAVFGFGPLEELLHDEGVTEIMVNGAHSVFYERGGKLFPSTQSFANDEQVRALIDRIIGPLGRRIDESSPMVNARLPQGHRVNAVIPPLALDGPVLTIRKFREHLITLDEMEEARSLESSVKQLLIWAVLMKKNIAVSGGTGSGKTTLLNALSCVIPPEERIVTIEDSAELRFLHHPHVVRLEARSRNAEGVGEVTIQELVINSLRMRPDRIIVGECRSREALDMLQAMTTGHDGSLTTLHANSVNDAVARLSTMVRYAADIPINVIEGQVASAIDLMVQTVRAVDGRRYVQEIASLETEEEKWCKVDSLYRWGLGEEKGSWIKIPEWVESLEACKMASREEVEKWKQQASLPA